MNNKGYVTALALISIGVLSFLALLYFFSRSQLAQNLFPTLAKSRSGSTLGVFAQNSTRTGNLGASMNATPAVSRTPTPTVVQTPTITRAPNSPSSLVTQNTQSVRPTVRPTIAPTQVSTVKSIPASGTPTILIVTMPLLLATGMAIRQRAK